MGTHNKNHSQEGCKGSSNNIFMFCDFSLANGYASLIFVSKCLGIESSTFSERLLKMKYALDVDIIACLKVRKSRRR